jgi:putative DNA primase/helicase
MTRTEIDRGGVRTATDAAKATEAAHRARALLDASQPASTDHPYIGRKKIATDGLRQIGLADAVRILRYSPKGGKDQKALEGPSLLVVPVYIDGVLSTVELIDAAGSKSFLSGGKMAGGYWAASHLPDCDWTDDLTILIGEGVATVASASMATGYIGVAALSCGNLLPAGQMIRKRYPSAKIIYLADLGIGEKRCAEAARAIDGYVAVPNFGDGQ